MASIELRLAVLAYLAPKPRRRSADQAARWRTVGLELIPVHAHRAQISLREIIGQATSATRPVALLGMRCALLAKSSLDVEVRVQATANRVREVSLSEPRHGPADVTSCAQRGPSLIENRGSASSATRLSSVRLVRCSRDVVWMESLTEPVLPATGSAWVNSSREIRDVPRADAMQPFARKPSSWSDAATGTRVTASRVDLFQQAFTFSPAMCQFRT